MDYKKPAPSVYELLYYLVMAIFDLVKIGAICVVVWAAACYVGLI